VSPWTSCDGLSATSTDCSIRHGAAMLPAVDPAARCGQNRPSGYGQAELVHHWRGDRGNRRKQDGDDRPRLRADAYARPGGWSVS
jgi:hypothetical protein